MPFTECEWLLVPVPLYGELQLPLNLGVFAPIQIMRILLLFGLGNLEDLSYTICTWWTLSIILAYMREVLSAL